MASFFAAVIGLFRIVFNDPEILVLIEVDDLLLADADERMRREIIRIAYDGAAFAVIQHDRGPEEHILDVLEHCHADSRIELGRVHVLGDAGDGRERGLLDPSLTLGGDVVVDIRNRYDACVFVDILAGGVEGEAAAIHAFMVLQRRELHALGDIRFDAQDVMAVQRMLHVVLEILSAQVFYLLVEQPLGEIRLADAFISYLTQGRSMYGCKFAGQRYDCGNKLQFIVAQIELGMQHPEVRDKLEAYLKQSL